MKEHHNIGSEALELDKDDTISDSGSEGLGAIGKAVSNKKFTARIYYEEANSDKKELVPMLNLIPPAWRLKTNAEDSSQGDHTIPYSLLLQTLTYCSGKNVKTLPQTFFGMVGDILPEFKSEFKDLRDSIKSRIADKRLVRKDALKSLADKDADYLRTLNSSLKMAEIEDIARHIESVADKFMDRVNAIEGSSFPQNRKENVIEFIAEKMGSAVDVETKWNFFSSKAAITALQGSDELKNFREEIKLAINQQIKAQMANSKAGSVKNIVTDEDIKAIAKSVMKKPIIESLRAKSVYTQESELVDFLKTITPLKKQNEGQAIRDITELAAKLKNDSTAVATEANSESAREAKLQAIGQYFAKLFDYPKTNNPDKQYQGVMLERVDDEYVLYLTLARHLVISSYAFADLKDLVPYEKKIIHESFFDQVLRMQLWEGHPVCRAFGAEAVLDRQILSEMVMSFVEVDAEGNFAMKPKSQHPNHLYSSKRREPKEIKLEEANARGIVEVMEHCHRNSNWEGLKKIHDQAIQVVSKRTSKSAIQESFDKGREAKNQVLTHHREAMKCFVEAETLFKAAEYNPSGEFELEINQLLVQADSLFTFATQQVTTLATNADYANFLIINSRAKEAIPLLESVIERKSDGTSLSYNQSENLILPKSLQQVSEPAFGGFGFGFGNTQVNPLHLAYFLLIKIKLGDGQVEEAKKLHDRFVLDADHSFGSNFAESGKKLLEEIGDDFKRLELEQSGAVASDKKETRKRPREDEVSSDESVMEIDKPSKSPQPETCVQPSSEVGSSIHNP